jgi:methylmalonyl-CoA/ethylmalonyl-CoA epimerase
MSGDRRDPLGNTVQLAVVTDDFYGAMESLLKLGIGPWAVFDVSPDDAEIRVHGELRECSMRVGIATHGSLSWEVTEPTGGQSLQQEFLDAGGHGLHHIGVDGSGLSFDQQGAALEKAGYEELQGGHSHHGTVRFAHYGGGHPGSPIVEIFSTPEGWEPDPDEWYPPPHVA